MKVINEVIINIIPKVITSLFLVRRILYTTAEIDVLIIKPIVSTIKLFISLPLKDELKKFKDKEITNPGKYERKNEYIKKTLTIIIFEIFPILYLICESVADKFTSSSQTSN